MELMLGSSVISGLVARAAAPTVSWLWLLVLYLWVTGGKGWVIGYEFSQRRRMKKVPKVVAFIAWPAFSGLSILGEWYAHLFPKAND